MPNQKKESIPKENTPELLDLLNRCASQDLVAIRAFFNKYSEDIYNFPMKVFHLDEDQASDFFLYAFEKLKNGKRFKSFQGRSKFRTWFYTVLRNLVIDWMRTIKQLETVQLSSNKDSDETSLIENIADNRPIPGDLELDTIEPLLSKKISSLSLENRCIFKLSYLFYFHLEAEELGYLAKMASRDEGDVLRDISALKNDLTNKALKNITSLDKVTALYLNIIDLKSRRDQIKKELDQYPENHPQWYGVGPHDLKKLEQLIEKKVLQKEQILEKKERGNFIVRAPHREITKILNLVDGSISVILNRISEKMQRDE